VVMLLNVDKERSAKRANRYWPVMAGFGIVIASEIVLLIVRGKFAVDAGQLMKPGFGSVNALGVELYTNYLVPFEIASVILLVGLVGAVMLAKKVKE